MGTTDKLRDVLYTCTYVARSIGLAYCRRHGASVDLVSNHGYASCRRHGVSAVLVSASARLISNRCPSLAAGETKNEGRTEDLRRRR